MHIITVSRRQRIVLTDEDEIYPMVSLQDIDGDNTDNVELAFTAVVRFGPKTFIYIRLDDYDPVRLH